MKSSPNGNKSSMNAKYRSPILLRLKSKVKLKDLINGYRIVLFGIFIRKMSLSLKRDKKSSIMKLIALNIMFIVR